MEEEEPEQQEQDIKIGLKELKEFVIKHKTPIITIMVVVALGLIIVNQFLSFQYKTELLSTACQLCESFGNDCVQKGSALLLN